MQFKEELSIIVPTSFWKEAAATSRSKGRSLSHKVSELNGMISIRSRDRDSIKEKLEISEIDVIRKEDDLQRRSNEMKEQSSVDSLSCKRVHQ